jgi:flagellar protein FlaG
MDINTNTLQHQAAGITPLRIVNTKQSVDSSVKSVDDATRKAKTLLESASASVVAEAKDTKNPDDLKQAVSKLNDYVQNMQRDLQFSIDQESGSMVVKVIDTKSEKVIRQIPTEETLRLARNLVERSDEAIFNIFSSRA